MPLCLPGWLEEYVAQLSVSCDQLSGESKAPTAKFVTAVKQVWFEYQKRWQDVAHREFLERVAASEVELIPPDVWSAASPLQWEDWRAVRAAVDDLLEALPPKQAVCFRVGSLVVQVTGLIDHEQDELFGDRRPISPLRAALLEMKSVYPVLAEVDLELYDSDTMGAGIPGITLLQEKLDRIHEGLLRALTSPSSAPEEKDLASQPSWTPPELAELMRVSSDKVLFWIRSGELHAVNTASGPAGRPRWLVLREDFEPRQQNWWASLCSGSFASSW